MFLIARLIYIITEALTANISQQYFWVTNYDYHKYV